VTKKNRYFSRSYHATRKFEVCMSWYNIGFKVDGRSTSGDVLAVNWMEEVSKKVRMPPLKKRWILWVVIGARLLAF